MATSVSSTVVVHLIIMLIRFNIEDELATELSVIVAITFSNSRGVAEIDGE